ncbi:hypothetical protein BDP27DRAFT_1520516 [Rhodocollybia butyracea]|uniref:Uncharacterized protein n=1 Tax=Rhodocollybia butyracea TaxID=206335 RepID=A0A9P5P5Z6_9AGAR|nr:hypothetical protein BDP27DRAFT_1520516 [Rhodocollybia butyracea]
MERYIWTAHPYVAYTMVDKLSVNPFTLLAGPCLVTSLVYKSLFLWISFTLVVCQPPVSVVSSPRRHLRPGLYYL